MSNTGDFFDEGLKLFHKECDYFEIEDIANISVNIWLYTIVWDIPDEQNCWYV